MFFTVRWTKKDNNKTLKRLRNYYFIKVVVGCKWSMISNVTQFGNDENKSINRINGRSFIPKIIFHLLLSCKQGIFVLFYFFQFTSIQAENNNNNNKNLKINVFSFRENKSLLLHSSITSIENSSPNYMSLFILNHVHVLWDSLFCDDGIHSRFFFKIQFKMMMMKMKKKEEKNRDSKKNYSIMCLLDLHDFDVPLCSHSTIFFLLLISHIQYISSWWYSFFFETQKRVQTT